MCGIFGIIHFNNKPIDTAKAEQAAKVLSRRGPDDYGTSLSPSGKAFFCHYRLSIIELSKLGHQPMTTEDGRYTILYNGEIYNYKAIKNSELKIKNWNTDSDTETILKLYAMYGEESLKKLRGMFALVVWDEKEKSLFAARDRFGIKPFYYLINNDEFIFSSELKAIKQYKNDLTVSQMAIDLYLTTGSVTAPHTIYNGTKSLLPGECMKINPYGGSSLKKWWSFEDILDSSGRIFNYDSNAREEIRSSLMDSLKAHCVSDVEVGAFLSGGIDSTSVVSLMKQVEQQKIRTVSVTFPGSSIDESLFAKTAAEKYGVDHTEYPLTEAEVINDIDKFFCGIDQPTIDGLNTYFVSKAAASLGLKAVMSGLGGDELFGGYSTFRFIPQLELINKIPFSGIAMKIPVPFIKHRVPAKAIEYLKNAGEDMASYKLFRDLFTSEELKSLGRDQHYEPVLHDEESLPSIYHSTFITQHSALEYVSYLETTNYMANQLLRDSDIFSMCHSLELRVPFVDDRLYSVVLKYIDKGYNKKHPKRMLVNAVGNLPEEIINRKKMGFTFPFDEWMHNGELGRMVKDYIISCNSSMNKKGIEDLFLKFDKGKIHWSRLWALFVLNKFL
jgi:asparagine synthase (glutamine-hydrolysing)